MKKILLGISLLFTLSQADSFAKHEYTVRPHQAQIVTRTIYKNHFNKRVPSRIFYQRGYQNNYTHNDQTIGVLIGGIVGGILGHQIGGGSGKVVATVGGAIIGSIAGSNLSNRDFHHRYESYEPSRRWVKTNWRHHRRGFDRQRIVIIRKYR